LHNDGLYAFLTSRLGPTYLEAVGWLMGCLHDPANVQQTSSKCIEIHVLMLDVCWKFAGRLLPYIIQSVYTLCML